MYLAKSFTLEDNNCASVVTFDLFIKEGNPILMESALSNGSRGTHTSYGYEEIFERLWVLSTMCSGDTKVRRVIHNLRNCLLDERYGSK